MTDICLKKLNISPTQRINFRLCREFVVYELNVIIVVMESGFLRVHWEKQQAPDWFSQAQVQGGKVCAH